MHNTCGFVKSNQNAGSGIRERLLKGIGAQGFSQVVQVFIRLAEVPLLLSFWGPHLYGEWLMLSAIPVYLTISDGGFARAACREMTIRSSAENRTGVIVIFQSTWILLIVVSMVTSLLAFGFVKVAPLEDWLGFSSMTIFEIKTILLIFVAHVLLSFQGGLLKGGFWAARKYANGMYLFAVTQLLEFCGLGIAVLFGGRPVHAALGYLAGRLLGTGLIWLGQCRVSPWLKHGYTHASWCELKRLAIPAFSSLAFPLGNALNIQGMRLVVGLAIGPSAVAVFVPLRTLSRIVMQPGAIINRLIEPELALAYGSDDNSRFRSIFTRSCQLSLWGSLGVCFLVGPGAYWIFPIWTNGMVSLHWPTYLILLAVVLTNSIWYTAMIVPYAINCHGRIAIFYALVYGFTAFFIGFILSERLGIEGAALAILLTEVAMTVVVVRISVRIACTDISKWIKTVIHPPFDILNQAALIVRKTE